MRRFAPHNQRIQHTSPVTNKFAPGLAADPQRVRDFLEDKMGIIDLSYTEKEVDGDLYVCLSNKEFSKFGPNLLDIGDIGREGAYREGLAAIFDLEGFTPFCNQIDPHLVIPEFLSLFLDWLFKEISEEFTHKKAEDDLTLWCFLPFFAKFLGDGVLFLWDTKKLTAAEMGNLVVSLKNICLHYRNKFLPKAKLEVSKSPSKLRCGIARGQIISVGDGRDYVGACINVASRLQKLGQLSFAFSKRGFQLEKCFSKSYQEKFILAKASIRGIGEEELIFIDKSEYDKLEEKERKGIDIQS